MMTAIEALELGYGLLGGWGFTVKGMTESVLLNHMNQRQGELFEWIATIDPEFHGVDELAPVVGGKVDLVALEGSGAPLIGHLQHIAVGDGGTSSHSEGAKVRIVRVDDPRELPPRVTLRNRVLSQVGDDLQGVASLRLYYSWRPRPISPSGDTVLSLPDGFGDLLSYAVARFVLMRDIQTAQSPAYAYYSDEETKRLTALEAFVRGSYRALQSRFVQQAVPRPEITREDLRQ
jgi:hypothetical protein